MLKIMYKLFISRSNKKIIKNLDTHLNEHALRDIGLLDSQCSFMGSNLNFEDRNQIKHPPF